MCGAFLFGAFWWVVPLAGLLICLGLALVCVRHAGRGSMCGCGRSADRHGVTDTPD